MLYFKLFSSSSLVYRLVNYQKEPVLDCRSIRPTVCETEIPTGIEIKQSASGQLLAYLVPVVKPIDKEVSLSSYMMYQPISY